MLTRVNGPKDVLAGLIFVASGVALFAWSNQYEMGTATRMGPGYYPALLGLLLCLFGLGAMIKGVLATTPDPLPNRKIVPLLFLLAAVLSFALLIEPLGLVIASFACIFLACYQRLRTRPIEVLVIFLSLTAFNYIVFVMIFGMPIRLFWWS